MFADSGAITSSVGLDQMRVELPRLLAAGERLEGASGDEPLGLGREDGRDLVAGLHQESAELARLVGGDATGHPEKDPRAMAEAP